MIFVSIRVKVNRYDYPITMRIGDSILVVPHSYSGLNRLRRDTDGEGYFFTTDNAQSLVLHTKTAVEFATPSGNGMMVLTVAPKAVLLEGHPAAGEEEYIPASANGVAERIGVSESWCTNRGQVLNCEFGLGRPLRHLHHKASLCVTHSRKIHAR